ncbi:hypothetical protein ABT026_30845 [Streptomyces sp. NPDC002734]
MPNVVFSLSKTARNRGSPLGSRVRYAIDDDSRTIWLIYASPRHPKDTDR